MSTRDESLGSTTQAAMVTSLAAGPVVVVVAGVVAVVGLVPARAVPAEPVPVPAETGVFSDTLMSAPTTTTAAMAHSAHTHHFLHTGVASPRVVRGAGGPPIGGGCMSEAATASRTVVWDGASLVDGRGATGDRGGPVA